MFALLNISLFIFFSFSSLYRGSSVVDEFSAIIEDPPWMPTTATELQEPIVGRHHFGDFKIWLGYARVENPYSEEILYAPNAPALSVLFFRLVLTVGALLPNQLLSMWILFTGLQITLLAVTVVRLARTYGENLPVFAYLSLVITAPGILVCVDRGGSQILASCLAINYLLSVSRGDSRYTVIWLLFAVALKPYFVLCLLYDVAQRRARRGIKHCVIVGGANLLPFLAFDPPLQSAGRWFESLRSHEFGGRLLTESVSIYSAFERLHISELMFQATGLEKEWVSRVLGALILGMTAATVRYYPGRALRILSIMALTSFLVPLSHWYTTAWIAIALPLILHSLSPSKCLPQISRLGARMYCGGLLCQLFFVPFHTEVDTRFSPANPISQMLIFLGLVLLTTSFYRNHELRLSLRSNPSEGGAKLESITSL